MSRQAYLLAKAEETAALADRTGDPMTRQTLRHAAECWRYLAELEVEPTPLIIGFEDTRPADTRPVETLRAADPSQSAGLDQPLEAAAKTAS